MNKIRIGLDFDGVICDIDGWIKKNDLDPNEVTSKMVEEIDPKELDPIDGAFDVIRTGLVKAIITNRPKLDALKRWFSLWYGPVPVQVRTARYALNKGFECYRLRLSHFVDNEKDIVEEVKRWEVNGILFNYERDGNLFIFLKEKGVLY